MSASDTFFFSFVRLLYIWIYLEIRFREIWRGKKGSKSFLPALPLHLYSNLVESPQDIIPFSHFVNRIHHSLSSPPRFLFHPCFSTDSGLFDTFPSSFFFSPFFSPIRTLFCTNISGLSLIAKKFVVSGRKNSFVCFFYWRLKLFLGFWQRQIGIKNCVSVYNTLQAQPARKRGLFQQSAHERV